MNRKYLLRIFLVTLLIVLIVTGCSNQSTKEVSDELEVENQMNKWAEAWEIADTNYFKTTMKSDGIDFTIADDIMETNITIEQFIIMAKSFEFWGMCDRSEINVISINISNNSSELHGEWIIRFENIDYKLPAKVDLEKINDSWLIASINLGEPSAQYIGEENEEFDPARHNAYVSFKVDGEQYIFHDQYGGHAPDMSSIDPDSNIFSIQAYDYETDERFFLDFIFEGENAGEMAMGFYPVMWMPPGDGSNYYSYAGSEFSAVMESYGINEGLVEGTFSGYLYKDGDVSEESVHITEGFFYIEHEFNLPEVNIDNPTNNETVFGEVTISGTATDDSELDYVDVEIEGEFLYENHWAEGTNDWSFTFDSTQYENGQYNIRVIAGDEHNNYSRAETITINILND